MLLSNDEALVGAFASGCDVLLNAEMHWITQHIFAHILIFPNSHSFKDFLVVVCALGSSPPVLGLSCCAPSTQKRRLAGRHTCM